jgi:CheY-like chemotaxis protein
MILLVDDDPQFLEEAERVLGRREPVFFANTLKGAFDLMATIGQGVTVALVDLDLPPVDGFELIRKLHRGFPTLPLIAISGVVNAEVLESARAFGAVETLRKPVTKTWCEVIDRVRSKGASA